MVGERHEIQLPETSRSGQVVDGLPIGAAPVRGINVVVFGQIV